MSKIDRMLESTVLAALAVLVALLITAPLIVLANAKHENFKPPECLQSCKWVNTKTGDTSVIKCEEVKQNAP